MKKLLVFMLTAFLGFTLQAMEATKEMETVRKIRAEMHRKQLEGEIAIIQRSMGTFQAELTRYQGLKDTEQTLINNLQKAQWGVNNPGKSNPEILGQKLELAEGELKDFRNSNAQDLAQLAGLNTELETLQKDLVKKQKALAALPPVSEEVQKELREQEESQKREQEKREQREREQQEIERKEQEQQAAILQRQAAVLKEAQEEARAKRSEEQRREQEERSLKQREQQEQERLVAAQQAAELQRQATVLKEARIGKKQQERSVPPPVIKKRPSWPAGALGGAAVVVAVGAAIYKGLKLYQKRRITRVLSKHGLTLAALSTVQRDILAAAVLAYYRVPGYVQRMRSLIIRNPFSSAVSESTMWDMLTELYYRKNPTPELVQSLKDLIAPIITLPA